MPRSCTVCQHDQRLEIDAALLAAEPLRNVAKRTATSIWALHRHKRSHLPAKLARAKAAKEIAESNTLLARLRQLNSDTREVLQAARKAGDHDLRLRAITRVEKQLEIEGRLLGELNDGATAQINVQIVAPMILEALAPFPAARRAVADKLQEMGSMRETP